MSHHLRSPVGRASHKSCWDFHEMFCDCHLVCYPSDGFTEEKYSWKPALYSLWVWKIVIMGAWCIWKSEPLSVILEGGASETTLFMVTIVCIICHLCQHTLDPTNSWHTGLPTAGPFTTHPRQSRDQHLQLIDHISNFQFFLCITCSVFCIPSYPSFTCCLSHSSLRPACSVHIVCFLCHLNAR